MPKMKTRKSAAKRFKRTGTGKYTYNKSGRRHILGKKAPKRKRQLRRPGIVSSTDCKRLKAALPYGL